MKDLFRKSIPKTAMIHGVEVKKLPIGKYLDTINSMRDLPEILLKNIFPGMNTEEIFSKMKKLDEGTLFELLANMMSTVPDQALRFISTLLDIEYEKLRDEISPKELKDILKEFWKVNEMTDFFQDVSKAVMSSKVIQKMNKKN